MQGVHVITGLVALDGVARDQDRRLGQVHHRLGLMTGQAVGDRLRRRAHLPERIAGFDEVDAVGQAEGHQVAQLHPHLLEAAGDAVGAKVQFLPGDRAARVADRRPVRPFGGQLGQPPA